MINKITPKILVLVSVVIVSTYVLSLFLILKTGYFILFEFLEIMAVIFILLFVFSIRFAKALKVKCGVASTVVFIALIILLFFINGYLWVIANQTV